MEKRTPKRSGTEGSVKKRIRKPTSTKESEGKVVGEDRLSTEQTVRKIQLKGVASLLQQVVGRKVVTVWSPAKEGAFIQEEIEVYLLKKYPFLCWHPCSTTAPWGWRVTHTESGVAICYGLFGADLALGMTVALMQTKINWQKKHSDVIEEITTVAARRNRVGEILRRYIKLSLGRRALQGTPRAPKAYLKGERHRALLQAAFEHHFLGDHRAELA